MYLYMYVCIYIVHEYNHIDTHAVCSRDSQWYVSSMQHAYDFNVYHTYISAIFVCLWRPLATSRWRLTSGKRPKSMDAFQRPNCGKRGDALKLGSWMVDKHQQNWPYLFLKGFQMGAFKWPNQESSRWLMFAFREMQALEMLKLSTLRGMMQMQNCFFLVFLPTRFTAERSNVVHSAPVDPVIWKRFSHPFSFQETYVDLLLERQLITLDDAVTHKDAFDESRWGEVWQRWADPAGGFILCVHCTRVGTWGPRWIYTYKQYIIQYRMYIFMHIYIKRSVNSESIVI